MFNHVHAFLMEFLWIPWPNLLDRAKDLPGPAPCDGPHRRERSGALRDRRGT